MTMKLLVVGGGGREHAIVRALARNSDNLIYSVMGKRNPGIAALSQSILLHRETDIPKIVAFAVENSIDYAVIGPEAPLEAGITDSLEEHGIPVVGPSKAAARLETDKAFCREMMQSEGIAGCPRYRVFHDPSDAAAFIRDTPIDLAVKPIGLTGGKGVRIMGEHLDRDGAVSYVKNIGGNVVLEERLIGEEFTMQAFVDGRHVIPMPLVQDHKRAFEGDIGPNTGGMGSYSMPDHGLPFVTASDEEKARRIMEEVVQAMASIGSPYRGILYGQFMNTRNGPMVIEFNARFGDPEAMNVLSILETDFLSVIDHIISGNLSQSSVKFADKSTVCKYLVPKGYPDSSVQGRPVTVGNFGSAILYYANIEEKGGQLFTQNSRTMAFVGIGDTLSHAEMIAESAASSVQGDLMHRSDIGTEALLNKRVAHMKGIR